MMSAISGYFIIEDTGIGSVKQSKESREKLAKESINFVCAKCGALKQIEETKMKEKE